jgi:hypothetical protein
VFDPKQKPGVLSDIAPLAEIFVYLNFDYLVAIFYRLDHPERAEFGSLYCGLFICFATEYSFI